MKTVSLTITEAEGRKVFSRHSTQRDDNGVLEDGVSSFVVQVHRSVLPLLQNGVEISGYRIFDHHFTRDMVVTVLRIKSIDLTRDDFASGAWVEDVEVLVTAY